jgi:hypothetical protein
MLISADNVAQAKSRTAVACSKELQQQMQNGREEVQAMSEEEEKKAQTQRLRDLFEGTKGRRPQTDQELEDWLASPEGKAATAFEPTSLSRWGGTGRS